MVTISNYKSATNAEGEEFFLLQLMGGLESVQSKETGRFYLTAKKATISSTFDEKTCQSLIGTQMPGTIQKVEVEPYSYVIEETGEEVQLNHRYEYNPNPVMEEAVLEQGDDISL